MSLKQLYPLYLSFFGCYGLIEKLVDLGASIDTEFQVPQNCRGPTVLWTLLPDNRKVSIKLLRSAVFKGFCLLDWKRVHRTA